MMIDDILRNPKQALGLLKDKGMQVAIDDLKCAQVIDITNVSDYVYSMPQETWSIIEDVPNCAPPFNKMWFEWRMPEYKNTEGKIERVPCEYKHVRNAIFCLSNWNDELEHWNVGFILFNSVRDIIILEGFTGFSVSKEGKVIFNSKQPIIINNSSILIKNGIPKEDIASSIGFASTLVGVAISFMHCKNVISEEIRYPERLQRSRVKKGLMPLVIHKVLKIRPIKKILTEEGKTQEHGMKHALHICRGHFKDFSRNKGLFGKHKGLYWWDMHTRGDSKQGVVEKDYKVLTS
jgi:hypothetical protein